MGRLGKIVCPSLLLLAAFPASSLRGRAQNGGDSRTPSAQPQTTESPLAKNQIRVHANEVIAPVTVTDDETIRTALDKIGGELHAQYVLSYMPRAERPPGYYEIKVTVSRPDLTVRTRPGYYLDLSDRTQPAP
jgi:hypothetical protein